MANDLNQCIFIGRAGKDCECAYLPSGTAVAKFSLAVGYKFRETEETTWLNVAVFGGLGEKVAAEYVKKGSKVAVSGRLSVRQYDDRDGQKRTSVDLVADNLQLLDSRDGNSGQQGGGQQQQRPQQQRPQQQTQGGGMNQHQETYDSGDIPF